ncbi:MAG: ABC transporter ATP-binding protein, partial [Lacticaseibacillus rhamnosus]
MRQTPQLLTDVSADAILDIDRDQVLIDLTKLDEAAREKLVLGLVTHDVPYSVAPLSLADEFRLIFQKV